MSDTGHDEHEIAGHEIDKMPNRRLFNLLFGLSALTLVACIGVIQLFNLQVSDIEEGRARLGSFQLAEYKAEMDAVASGRGEIQVREYDGKETPRNYIPVAEAKKKLLENPDLLKARPGYPAWKNTDTYQALEQVRQQAAAAAAKQPQPPPPTPAPEEGEPPTDGGAAADDEGAAPAQERKPEPTEGAGAADDDEGADAPKPADDGDDAPKKPAKAAEDEPAPSDSGNPGPSGGN